MTDVDVVVVGAGPSGLLAAREAVRRGVSVAVLEEHVEVGLPSHCAGLVNAEGFKLLGVNPGEGFVVNKVYGARFHSPSGICFTVRHGEAAALVLDRTRFDCFLADEVVKAGGDVRLGRRVMGVAVQRGCVEVETGLGMLRCKGVILAEGSTSNLASRLGFGKLVEKTPLPAFQYEVALNDLDPGLVDVYFGRTIAPGFFAWVVPLDGERARVGLACNVGSPRRLLDAFMAKHLGKHRVLSWSSRPILVGGPIAETYAPRLVVVGDAAGQVKPTTGGGIVTGGSCGVIAGRIMAEAVTESDLSGKRLSSYERGWWKMWGRELRSQGLARYAANVLSDEAVDELFKVVVEEGLTEDIEVSGDIDFQSHVIRMLLRKPSVYRVLLKALGSTLTKPILFKPKPPKYRV